MKSRHSTGQPVLPSEFPHARYFPEAQLITWRPRGLFDEHLADRLLEFIETQERLADGPFNRFTDLDGLTEIRLKIAHTFKFAKQRRLGYRGPPVKSALFSARVVGYGMAQMYETLMERARIEVRAFRTIEAAAEWLGVPLEILTAE